MTSVNIDYYEQNSAEFFAATVTVDMANLHHRFLSHVPAGGLLLDAGCGSGRDTRAFIDAGFRVVAFDASPALATLASQHVGQPVHVRVFADVVEQACYDGIWACASLLHLPSAEIPTAIRCLWTALKPGGSFYASFSMDRAKGRKAAASSPTRMKIRRESGWRNCQMLPVVNVG